MKTIQPGSPDKTTARSEFPLIVITVVSTLFFILFPLFHSFHQRTTPGLKNFFITASAKELGGFAPHEIKITANDTAKLSFWAVDVVHSFNMPQLGIDKVLPVGEHAEVTIATQFREDEKEYRYLVNGKSFTFDKEEGVKPLVLEFKCNRYCSHQHWDMRGEIIIMPPK